jgi:hypothetical protein
LDFLLDLLVVHLHFLVKKPALGGLCGAGRLVSISGVPVSGA